MLILRVFLFEIIQALPKQSQLHQSGTGVPWEVSRPPLVPFTELWNRVLSSVTAVLGASFAIIFGLSPQFLTQEL